jgi:hypothetical protein
MAAATIILATQLDVTIRFIYDMPPVNAVRLDTGDDCYWRVPELAYITHLQQRNYSHAFGNLLFCH